MLPTLRCGKLPRNLGVALWGFSRAFLELSRVPPKGPEEALGGIQEAPGKPQGSPKRAPRRPLLGVPGTTFRKASWEHLGWGLSGFSRAFLELSRSFPRGPRKPWEAPQEAMEGFKGGLVENKK